MEETNKQLYTGPKIFIKRLLDHIQIPDDVQLTNPDNNSIAIAKEKFKKGKKIIGRLDGAYGYKITIQEMLGILASRGHINYKVRNSSFSFEPSKWLTNLINKKLNRNSIWVHENAHGIIFQSEFSKKMHESFVNFSERVPTTIINNGVDINNFYPLEDKDKEKRNSFPDILISCSTYRPHKRLKESVELVNKISKYYPKIRLHVLGDLETNIREELGTIDTGRCEFYGKLTLEQLPEFYRRFDLQFSLSLFDACPNVVVEGLASGLPVVTPYESGAFELINRNKDWAVEEKVDLIHLENHRCGMIPKINYENYCTKILSILEDLKQHQEEARFIAEKKLDIKKVSESYLSFMNTVTR